MLFIYTIKDDPCGVVVLPSGASPGGGSGNAHHTCMAGTREIKYLGRTKDNSRDLIGSKQEGWA